MTPKPVKSAWKLQWREGREVVSRGDVGWSVNVDSCCTKKVKGGERVNPPWWSNAMGRAAMCQDECKKKEKRMEAPQRHSSLDN